MRRRWILPGLLLLAVAPDTAAANCDALRQHIARLDQAISAEPSAQMRSLRLQDRNNYVRTYNACLAGQGGSARSYSGGGSGGGLAGTLGMIGQGLGLFSQGVELANQIFGGSEEAPMEEAEAEGDDDEEDEVAEDSSGFKTDEEIEAECAGTANPSICTLAAMDARDSDPAYKEWQAEQQAERDRELAAAQARVEQALLDAKRKTPPTVAKPATPAVAKPSVTASTSQTARPTVSIPAVATPGPTVRPVDADLARCRGGASQPETVLGCYEMKAGNARAEMLRAALRRSLRERIAAMPGGKADEKSGYPPMSEWDRIAATLPVRRRSTQAASAGRPGTVAPPPAGWRRDVLTEAQCRKWNGIFHTPDGSAMSVCDYPATPAFTGGAELQEQSIRALTEGQPR